MAARYNYLVLIMVDSRIVHGLLNVIANMSHSASQKAASETLLVIIILFHFSLFSCFLKRLKT